MSLRETIGQNPRAAASVGGALLVIALAAIGFHLLGGGSRFDVSGSMYYSDDDGKTYFADRGDRITPFDHNGQPTVGAVVYRCGAGKPFVTFLMRYTDDARAALQAAQAGSSDEFRRAVLSAQRQEEVKQPGGRDWFPIDSADGRKLIVPKCPEGESGVLTPVAP